MIATSEIFKQLKDEKKDAILSSALDEFAAKGYAFASTNEITKKAGISKGALFHYFGNKRTLFLFLCDYTVEILESEFFSVLKVMEKDLMIRLEKAVGLKLKLLARYSSLFAFCSTMLAETSPDVAEDVRRFKENTMKMQREALFTGLDCSLLKEEIPWQDGMKMLWWILEGYSNELSIRYTGKMPLDVDMDKEIKEFETFMKLVRNIFYATGNNDKR